MGDPGPGHAVRRRPQQERVRRGAPVLPDAGVAVLQLHLYRFELVAAGVGGDLAYTVGYEHTSVSIDAEPVAPYTLRVTHLYRREDGDWKIVHRHVDPPPADPPLAGAVRREGDGEPSP